MADIVKVLVSVTDSQGCVGRDEVWANFPARANIHKAHLIEDVVAPCVKDFIFTAPDEADALLRKAFSTNGEE